MNEYTPTWGLPVPVLTQQELLEELEIAQKDGAKFRNSVYAGTLVRALADCKRCMGGCRLWFIDDTEFARGCLPLFLLRRRGRLTFIDRERERELPPRLRSPIWNLFLVS